MRASSFIAVALAAVAAASPVSSSKHAVHERRETTSTRWVKRDRIEPASLLPLRIGLTQSNLDNAHEHLLGM